MMKLNDKGYIPMTLMKILTILICIAVIIYALICWNLVKDNKEAQLKEGQSIEVLIDE